jgi:methylated-DNA-[protein]-cysteine S-methyltransferase
LKGVLQKHIKKTQIMYWAHLDISIGTLGFQWNEENLLKEIRVVELRETGLNRSFLLSTRKIPDRFVVLLEGFRVYFETGTPLNDVAWEILCQQGWSDFQLKVYEATTLIPHGETRTYAWIADRLGQRGATRAVGQALRKNPLPILIPCHRVICTNDDLGGFMGKCDPSRPEIHLKKRLLELEENYRNPVFPFLKRSPVPLLSRSAFTESQARGND